MRGHHLTQLLDLDVQDVDELNLAGHDRRVRRLHGVGLAQLRGAQRVPEVSWMAAALASMSRRLARRSMATIEERDSFAARSGSGARSSSSRASGAARSSKACRAA